VRRLVLLIAACGSPAAAPPGNTTPAPKHDDASMPAEVTSFLDRYANCWHFRGEEGTTPARKQQILDGMNKWCPGNDEELARLRAEYTDRADVQTALDKTKEWQ
jgi:hypothetical protein